MPLKQIVPGIHTWSTFSEEKGFGFNGYAVETPAGTVVIDPPPPAPEELAQLDALAPYEAVFVTNRNHSRAAAALAERYGAPVAIHARDAERAEARAGRLVQGGETVGGEIQLVHVPGKSPGELAFFIPRRRALIVGDVVIGVPPGELSTYPDDKIDDKAALHRSAAKLLELDFDALLLCDGEPLPTGGKEALRRFVESTGGGPAPDRDAPAASWSAGPAATPPAAQWSPPRRRRRPRSRFVERMLRQRARHRRRHKALRVLWVLAAVLITLSGVAMLLLPGPALVVIPVGLAMLALEFRWAERALERSLEQADAAKRKARRASARQKMFSALAAAFAAMASVAAALAWDIPLLPF